MIRADSVGNGLEKDNARSRDQLRKDRPNQSRWPDLRCGSWGWSRGEGGNHGEFQGGTVSTENLSRECIPSTWAPGRAQLFLDAQ